MGSVMEDLVSLLAASRELLDTKDFEVERLQIWAAERNAIFCHLEQRSLAMSSADSSTMAALLNELLDLDAQICSCVMESQKCLGERIGATKRIRKAFNQGPYRTPQLLQRLA
jgi:hypothetical protein